MADVKLSVIFALSATDEASFSKEVVQATLAGLDAEICPVDKFRSEEDQVIDSLRGEYVLCVTDPVLPGDDAVRTACFFLDEHPEAGLVGVKLLNGRGEFLPESKRAFPSAWKKMLHKTGLTSLAAVPVGKEESSSKEISCEIPSAPFFLFRKETWAKVKELETHYLKASWEIALADRMRSGGFVNYYLPERVLWIKEAPVLRAAKPRTQVIGYEKNIEGVKAAIARKLPGQEFVNVWDLGENRILDAICRTNKMKQFTHIVFIYPEVRIEQILLFMERMPEKTMRYHIYYPEKELFIATTL